MTEKPSAVVTQGATATESVTVDGDQHALPPPWLWKPLVNKNCVSNSSSNQIVPDPFPPLFDPDIYKDRNRNKVPTDTLLNIDHYNSVGRGYGWVATQGQEIRQIINTDIVTKLPGNKLEIGPFLNPVIYGPGVKYFDVLDLNGLKERAKAVQYTSVLEVPIDYVHPTGDLTSIPDKATFSLIVSAHVIEHQLDLVRHFNAIGDLLVDGGYYTMIVSSEAIPFF